MIEPRSIQSQWIHMLAQHMCIHDENQLLKSCIKLRYHKFLARLPQTTSRNTSKNAGAQLCKKASHISKFQISSFGGFRVFFEFSFQEVIFIWVHWWGGGGFGRFGTPKICKKNVSEISTDIQKN